MKHGGNGGFLKVCVSVSVYVRVIFAGVGLQFIVSRL